MAYMFIYLKQVIPDHVMNKCNVLIFSQYRKTRSSKRNLFFCYRESNDIYEHTKCNVDDDVLKFKGFESFVLI